MLITLTNLLWPALMLVAESLKNILKHLFLWYSAVLILRCCLITWYYVNGLAKCCGNTSEFAVVVIENYAFL